MPYVMVPVPEEHVKEAMEAVLRITNRAAIIEWDADAVNELFRSVDEVSRSVMSTVARAVVRNGPLPDVDVAQTIELSNREILGVVRELNELAAASSHPVIVTSQQIEENLPNGRTREQRFLGMSRTVADLVRAAEKAELAASPHPLMTEPG